MFNPSSRVSTVDGRSSPKSPGTASGARSHSKNEVAGSDPTSSMSRSFTRADALRALPHVPAKAYPPRVPCFTVTEGTEPNERNRWVDWIVGFARTRIWAQGEDAVRDWAYEEWNEDAHMTQSPVEPSAEDLAGQLGGLRTEVRCSFEGYKDFLTKQSSEFLEYKAQSSVEQDRRLLEAEKRLRKLERSLNHMAQEVMSSSSASSRLETKRHSEDDAADRSKEGRKAAEQAAVEEAQRSLQEKLRAKAQAEAEAAAALKIQSIHRGKRARTIVGQRRASAMVQN